jgi:hypothetical protein
MSSPDQTREVRLRLFRLGRFFRTGGDCADAGVMDWSFGQVGRLQFHQGICDAGGGFIGDGVFGQ